MSERTFSITPEMEAELEQTLSTAHDAPREVFSSPRIRRRTDVVSDSEGITSGSSNNQQADPVNHPAHYTTHPSGVECITVTEWMSFNLGNAVKYLWRAGLKGYQVEDLQKAIWYIQREINRIQRVG